MHDDDYDDEYEHLRIFLFAMTTPFQLNRTLIKDTDKYENQGKKAKLVRNNKSWHINSSNSNNQRPVK